MPTFVAWVADHGVDRDVGFVTIERQAESSAEVRCVAVHRDFGGRGIGTRLLSHAEYRLAGSGVRSVSVKLPAFSKPDAEHTRNLHFFESRGYARREEANARVPDATYLTHVKVINPGDAETGA
ncbi:MAG: GNAT family N-acetyltransferase [Phycisphaerales bacterium]|nr:GNAT family N-acetyltransferase [Phycisphaerales bacterium]